MLSWREVRGRRRKRGPLKHGRGHHVGEDSADREVSGLAEVPGEPVDRELPGVSEVSGERHVPGLRGEPAVAGQRAVGRLTA